MINLNRSKDSVKPRVLSAVIALVLAVAMATMTVASAAAATIVGTIGGLEPGSIDADAKASLTISVTGANPFDDEDEDELPRGGVEGFTFTAYRIADVDLTTIEGWNRAEDYTLTAAKNADHSHEFTATTDANGFAYFQDIPVGLYYVTAAVPNDNNHSYKMPQDMLLTVPVGQSTDDAVFWQYDVSIKAKYAPDKPIIIPPIPIPVPVPNPGDPGREGGVLPKTPEGGVLDKQPTQEVEAKTPEGGVLDKQLAETGASVIWIAAIAVLLILTGFILLAKKRRDDSSEVRP